MRVLVPNLGSTSLKLQLIEMPSERSLVCGRVEGIGRRRPHLTLTTVAGTSLDDDALQVPDHRVAVELLLAHLGYDDDARAIDGVGLKTVHGGPTFIGSCLITAEVTAAMRDFCDVAPVHNPIYLEAIEIFRETLPGVPIVAVFEPGFHSTIPQAAQTYGVPYEWIERYGVRRYGFHGSSHRFVSQRAPELANVPASPLRLISCHLGGSSSVCAIRDGDSVDTSFGFSPQSGVEQGTRCGDLDPFVVLHLLEHTGMTPAELAKLLCVKSGLLGISGVSGDLPDIERAATEGNERAELAIDVFVHGIKKQIGAGAAVLGGLDVLAFTGGIGENSSSLRRRICADLGFLGVELDPKRNDDPAMSGGIVSPRRAGVKVVVLQTNEEIVVARETVRVLLHTTPQVARA